jgi:hypothetical protein
MSLVDDIRDVLLNGPPPKKKISLWDEIIAFLNGQRSPSLPGASRQTAAQMPAVTARPPSLESAVQQDPMMADTISKILGFVPNQRRFMAGSDSSFDAFVDPAAPNEIVYDSNIFKYLDKQNRQDVMMHESGHVFDFMKKNPELVDKIKGIRNKLSARSNYGPGEDDKEYFAEVFKTAIDWFRFGTAGRPKDWTLDYEDELLPGTKLMVQYLQRQPPFNQPARSKALPRR